MGIGDTLPLASLVHILLILKMIIILTELLLHSILGVDRCEITSTTPWRRAGRRMGSIGNDAADFTLVGDLSRYVIINQTFLLDVHGFEF